MFNEYLQSNDKNIIYCCLFEISKIIEYIESIKDDGSQFNDILFDSLLNLVFTSSNLNIQFESSQCVIMLTKLSDSYCKRIVKSSNIFLKLYNLVFETNDNIISNNLLTIIFNILESRVIEIEEVFKLIPDFFTSVVKKPIEDQNYPLMMMTTIISIFKSVINDLDFDQYDVIITINYI